ncbi:hypothetical protein C3L33_22588, partial [Rhododendron williamsianum]
MNSHFFLFCYLSFPILILTIVPKSSGSDYEQYTSCSQPFQCSNIPNLGYPFWGGNRPASCGNPNFELDCQSQAPQITISSIPYRVLSIHISTRALTVARAEFWNNPCPSPTHLPVNATLDTAHFDYSIDSQNMMIYYGCRASPGGTTPNQFPCTTNGTTTATNYFVMTSGGEGPDFGAAISGCSGSVVVRVNQAVAEGLMSVPPSINITEVLDSGFGLRWDANDTICSECVRSGGVCGSGSGYAFACLCRDQAYPEACNSTRAGSDLLIRSNSLLPTTHAPYMGCVLFSCDEPDPKVKLGEDGRSYQVSNIADGTIKINDPALKTLIESKDCDFSIYITPFYTPSVSFTISPNLTIFKCNPSSLELQREADEYFPIIITILMKDVKDTVYYLYPNDQVQDPTQGNHQPNCHLFQLPVLSSIDDGNSSDPFSLLTFDFSVEYHLSEECLSCLDDGGQCLREPREFQCFHKRGDEELGLHGNMDDEANTSARKMIIVGLWCIQTAPSHRPSMSRVVEMLEGSLESLQIPPKPFLSSPSRSPVEYSSSTLMS